MTTTEELLSECACSDQMSAAQLHQAETHRICPECETVLYCSRNGCIPKMPVQMLGREPMSGEAKLLIVAVIAAWAAVIGITFADKITERINAIWPTLVAALS